MSESNAEVYVPSVGEMCEGTFLLNGIPEKRSGTFREFKPASLDPSRRMAFLVGTNDGLAWGVDVDTLRPVAPAPTPPARPPCDACGEPSYTSHLFVNDPLLTPLNGTGGIHWCHGCSGITGADFANRIRSRRAAPAAKSQEPQVGDVWWNEATRHNVRITSIDADRDSQFPVNYTDVGDDYSGCCMRSALTRRISSHEPPPTESKPMCIFGQHDTYGGNGVCTKCGHALADILAAQRPELATTEAKPPAPEATKVDPYKAHRESITARFGIASDEKTLALNMAERDYKRLAAMSPKQRQALSDIDRPLLPSSVSVGGRFGKRVEGHPVGWPEDSGEELGHS